MKKGNCVACGGNTQKKLIPYVQWYKRKLVVIEKVPADVCNQCGEEYFDPETVNRIQETIYSGEPEKVIDTPVYSWKAPQKVKV